MFNQVVLTIVILAATAYGGIQPGQGFLPGGNILTVDYDGPYDLSLLSTQANEIKAGIAAKKDYTDKDIVDFLVNVECLEGLFDTWGTFGRGFVGNLELSGPKPIGARKANLTYDTEMYLQEVALNEQGHALFTRQAGGKYPCPLIDFDQGFNDFYAAAYGLYPDRTIEEEFGEPFDPFKNDANFVTSVLALEELGATGNKGLVGLLNNLVLANGVAGLATSATAQSTIERFVLWRIRDAIVEPFGETVEQVFARISALRDSLDGPQFDDQGLSNTDPRNIAVPKNFINMIPTDVRGLTFSRTPQMNLNILFLGNEAGKGTFFPKGIYGRINSPKGYDAVDSGVKPLPPNVKLTVQQTKAQAGPIAPPITGPTPKIVPGIKSLTQDLGGPYTTATAKNRGLNQPSFEQGTPFTGKSTTKLANPKGKLSPKYTVCDSDDGPDDIDEE